MNGDKNKLCCKNGGMPQGVKEGVSLLEKLTRKRNIIQFEIQNTSETL